MCYLYLFEKYFTKSNYSATAIVKKNKYLVLLVSKCLFASSNRCDFVGKDGRKNYFLVITTLKKNTL